MKAYTSTIVQYKRTWFQIACRTSDSHCHHQKERTWRKNSSVSTKSNPHTYLHTYYTHTHTYVEVYQHTRARSATNIKTWCAKRSERNFTIRSHIFSCVPFVFYFPMLFLWAFFSISLNKILFEPIRLAVSERALHCTVQNNQRRIAIKFISH